MNTFTSVLHKPTGQRYVMHIKKLWGETYFSFDEINWHKTRLLAFANTTKLVKSQSKTRSKNDLHE